jgi:uncharacterized membrane protein HdeD (DUF308 family)
MATTATPDRSVNYAFILGGLTGVVFGIILLIRQEEAISLLAVVLGLWWLIHGAFLVFSVFIDSTDWGWKVAIGILGMIAGILVLSNPTEAARVFQGLFGVYLGVLGILIGIAAFVGAFRGGGLGAGVFGAVSVIMGVLILFNAEFTTVLLITLFGALLIINGVVSIYLGLKTS